MSRSRLLSFENWRRYMTGRSQLLFDPQDAEIVAAEDAPVSTSTFDPLGFGRPLRVALAYCHFDYGMRARGISFETTAFRDPLCWLGCEVIELRTDVLANRGSKFAAEVVPEIVFRANVDVFFIIPFKEEVDPRTVGQIRDQLGIPTVAWFSDDQWRFDDYTKRFLPYLSAAVTTSAHAVEKYKSHGFDRVIKSQWSANHRIFRPMSLPRIYDLSFIGQPHSNRREMVTELRRAGLTVATHGFGWPEGRVSLRELVIISNQSRVCLNFSNASRGRVNQIKARDFEIPAMSRPMLTADTEELGEYFTDREVAVYRDSDEMVTLARGLIKDDAKREAMAGAGHARFLADHTAEKRLATVFDTLATRGWIGPR